MPLTYKTVMRIIKDYGYIFVVQNGSHQRYQIDSGKRITIPYHKEFKPGTGKSILELIALHNTISIKDIIKKYNIKL